jgi:hypothetical protein
MPKMLHDIIIVNDSTGKIANISEINADITAGELLEAYAQRVNVPVGARGVFVRKLTGKQLLNSQSLTNAGIEDKEVLVCDFERTAGGHMEFYENGGVKLIETTPEETPYLAEILREVRRLNQEIREVDKRLTSISAEIKDLHNSIVIISGKDTNALDSKTS